MRSKYLISVADLEALQGDARLRVIDASWYLPNEGRDGRAEFLEQRIPGAVYFDIDHIADTTSGLPHTLASAEAFATHVGQLGIAADDILVVYDGAGLFSAPRVAWNLRVMGAQSVRVLDGGMPAWQRAKAAMESGTPKIPVSTRFEVSQRHGVTADRLDVTRHLDEGTAVVVDVRPAARFSGQLEEPRAGVRSGHMPGAINVPFTDLLVSGALAPDDQLHKRFSQAGISADDLVVTSCGSGVTAAIALLALDCIGHEHHALYDGSWSEWGSRSDTAVVSDR